MPLNLKTLPLIPLSTRTVLGDFSVQQQDAATKLSPTIRWSVSNIIAEPGIKTGGPDDFARSYTNQDVDNLLLVQVAVAYTNDALTFHDINASDYTRSSDSSGPFERSQIQRCYSEYIRTSGGQAVELYCIDTIYVPEKGVLDKNGNIPSDLQTRYAVRTNLNSTITISYMDSAPEWSESRWRYLIDNFVLHGSFKTATDADAPSTTAGNI